MGWWLDLKVAAGTGGAILLLVLLWFPWSIMGSIKSGVEEECGPRRLRKQK
jgi:hypothetical protein